MEGEVDLFWHEAGMGRWVESKIFKMARESEDELINLINQLY